MDRVPICVPVELRPQGPPPGFPRFFRTAVAISQTDVLLRKPVPQELAGRTLQVRLLLPLDLDPPPDRLVLPGRAAEVVEDAGEETEHTELRLVTFLHVPERERRLLELYILSHAADE